VTNRYLAQIRDPFNRFDDRTALADIGVAFAWQSGHRPLQRGTTYGIDGAFPDSLQPALLRVYRWASVKWHKFLNATSKQESRCDLLTLETRPSMGKTPGRRKRQFQELLSPRRRLLQIADDLPNVNEREAARLPIPHESTLHVCATSSEHGKPDENGTHHPLLQHQVSKLSRSCGASFDRSGTLQVSPLDTTSDVVRDGHRASRQWEATSHLLTRPNSNVLHPDDNTPDLVDQFDHLADYVLVCKTHGYGAGNLRRHLADLHTEHRSVKNIVLERFVGVEVLVPETAELPAALIAPFSCLAAPVDAYFCHGIDKTCGYLSINCRKIADHCKKTHG
jgi:hypothetical protein